MLAQLVLAAAKTPKVPKSGEGVKSGPIGLAVILVLCIAVYFLMKSMSKHLKRVREEFPTDQAQAGPNVSVARKDSAQSAVVVPSTDGPPKLDSA
jgi:hypothetical protein